MSLRSASVGQRLLTTIVSAVFDYMKSPAWRGRHATANQPHRRVAERALPRVDAVSFSSSRKKKAAEAAPSC